ncbi:MAG: hypothetical protein NTV88_02960 [Candidatus Micrarchaeota archaeon]|nr:hypothetical protein [Candidatus Micrarchaeota archaeon]
MSIQPYKRTNQVGRKIADYSAGANTHGFDPYFPDMVKLHKFRKPDGPCGNRILRHIDRYTSPTVLNAKQKEQFRGLLMNAYEVSEQAAANQLYNTSLFVKLKFAENPDAFFINTVELSNGTRQNGLFVRHTNPDGTEGGFYEATAHFHMKENGLVISPDSYIIGGPVLKGRIKLFHSSKMEGGGLYQNCILSNNSLLISSSAKSTIFRASYAYKSAIYPPESGYLQIVNSGLKYSKVQASQNGAFMINSETVDKTMYDLTPESFLDAERFHSMPSIPSRVLEICVETPLKLGIKGFGYASAFLAGGLYARLKGVFSPDKKGGE